jgi:flagellar basal-body rod modification protein FlgD
MTTTYGPVGTFPTMSTTAATSSTALTTSAESATKDPNAVNTDMFLKLLVAQLKYQDPSNATDPSEFLSQSAQFSAVEKLTALETLTQKAYDSSRQQTAASLVGRTITYTTAGGDSATGVVTSVSVSASTPNLTVNGITVPLDAVTSVGSSTTSQTSSTQTDATTGGGGTG